MASRRRRSGVIALAAAGTLVSGCGGLEANGPPGSGEDCPDAERELTAAEVIGPVPAGYKMSPPKDNVLDAFLDPVTDALGDAYLGTDSQVLVKRGSDSGVIVSVVRSSKTSGDPEDLIKGAEAASEDSGETIERVEVAGRPGVLRHPPDQSTLVVSTTGPCAALVLLSDKDAVMRDIIGVLPER